ADHRTEVAGLRLHDLKRERRADQRLRLRRILCRMVKLRTISANGAHLSVERLRDVDNKGRSELDATRVKEYAKRTVSRLAGFDLGQAGIEGALGHKLTRVHVVIMALLPIWRQHQPGTVTANLLHYQHQVGVAFFDVSVRDTQVDAHGEIKNPIGRPRFARSDCSRAAR